MIDLVTLKNDMKNGKLDKCYVFVGNDEGLIKESINNILSLVLDPNFKDFNYAEFDGNFITSVDEIIAACDTVPFMSQKRVVIIYRATFLEKEGGVQSEFKKFLSYINDLPNSTLLIMYNVQEGKRSKPERVERNLKRYKGITFVNSKLNNKEKRTQMLSIINKFFKDRNKDIDKVCLMAFYELLKDSNVMEIENEIEKLCCYVEDRDITKDDINSLQKATSDQDVFDMISALSERNLVKALELLEELIFKGETIEIILFLIEKQYKNLLFIKLLLEERCRGEEIWKKLKINEFVYKNMEITAKRYSKNQMKSIIKKCLDTEQKLKSGTTDRKMEMELLFIYIVSFVK